jgi:hypothetical protein
MNRPWLTAIDWPVSAFAVEPKLRAACTHQYGATGDA